MPTTMFGPYAVEELVGAGHNGTVWRARHTELGRFVAIKSLPPHLCDDKAALDRLRTEARHLTELEDPHIVAVYDFVEDSEQPYLVTEWVDGETLRELLDRTGKLRPEQSLGVLRGALQGLAYAHERRLVHGDISLSNLVVDTSGTTKLIDFGLAVPTGEPGVSGTPAYLSPEAAAGDPLTPASDVYSSGAVLFQLLSGVPPFSGRDALATIRAHREEPAPALRDHGPELADLLDRALRKQAVERPADAASFLAELEDAALARYGVGWLSAASVAGLTGLGTALGAATLATGGAVGSSASAVAGTETVTALATATAETGGSNAQGIANTARQAGRSKHLFGAHPVVASTVGVVAVAAGVSIAVVATTGQSKPPPLPEAVLLASSPIGSFSATGAISSTTNSQLKVGKLGTFPWTITEKCTATACAAIVKSTGSTFQFKYAGDAFTSTTIEHTRVTCVLKNGKEVPGATALSNHSVVWTLRVVKRAPAGPDGPGRAIELAGTALETTNYTDLTGGCENTVDQYVTKYSYTIRRN